ncbi:hypothetical protein AAGS61_15030 [Lysinibacillus sp. KU-BSD001]|uniref:hypothetical protein n=1 Tax=Lysinibacillus sp. KU-BSD001 TaxID=3141328 RepID=UPI0036E90F56
MGKVSIFRKPVALIEELYYEGGLCSWYSTFFICNSDPYNGNLIGVYYIQPANKVTVNELSEFFNQKIEIKAWENVMTGGYPYSSEIMINGMHNLVFNDESSHSSLKMITYVPN